MKIICKWLVLTFLLAVVIAFSGCIFNHEHIYELSIVDPTCTRAGYKYSSCVICGYSYEHDSSPALGHVPSLSQGKSPSCTESGYSDGRICANCGMILEGVETIPATGHSPTVKCGKLPTCTESGYSDEEICSVCSVVLVPSESIPATGHMPITDPIVHAPTCTEEGYKLYSCGNCYIEYKDDFIPAIDHSPIITVEEIPPTCIESGYTSELTCQVCNGIIQAVTEIPATGHNLIEVKEMVDATCTNYGVTAEIACDICLQVIKVQEYIEPYGHNDFDLNSLCDACGTPYGDNVTYIDSVEDLKKINENLSGIYKLTANIDLTGISWIALGSSATPFSGYFYGDNYKIKGLTLSNTSGALFECISGTVDSVILEDITFDSYNYSMNAGGLAVYNKGTIKNCILIGNNIITQSVERTQSTGWPSYGGSSVSYTNVFGGFCAINDGVIAGCKVERSFSSTLSNMNYFKLAPSVLFPPLTAEMYESKSVSTVYFGGICGKNNGTIKKCTVSNADYTIISVEADYDKYGSSYAITNAYVGGIVGTNSNFITDCKAISSYIVESLGSESVSGSNGGQHPRLNLYSDSKYKGLIGSNSGTVENVLNI